MNDLGEDFKTLKSRRLPGSHSPLETDLLTFSGSPAQPTVPFNEPKNQAEIDRNGLIACWLMILPSLVLYFEFHASVLGFLLIGGSLRLIIDAVRLPNGQRGFYKILFIAPGGILALSLMFENLLSTGWIYLTFFLAFVAYADWRFVRYNRERVDATP